MSRRTKRVKMNPLKPLRLFRVDLGRGAYERNNRWRWKLRALIRDCLHVPLSEAKFADVWVALRFRGLA
jgi:hypothetical protein